MQLITFKGFVYSWSQAINFVNEKTNPLKVFKTVKTNSGLWFQWFICSRVSPSNN